MLINCPECELQISDKAEACPHCGYPIVGKRIIRKSNRRKRLPNGFGQISQIKSKNLRKPFRAMVTVGFNESGRPIAKLLKPVSYFKTYNEAYEALLKYNKNPFDVDKVITFEEVFDSFMKSIENDTATSTKQHYRAAWKYLSPLKNLDVRSIRRKYILDILETPNLQKSVPKNILNLTRQLAAYAMKYEYIDTDFTSGLSTKPVEVTDSFHKTFTDEEIDILWKNINDPEVSLVMIAIYTGMRPGEIRIMTDKNINLEERVIIGGIKTKSGINRTIPIHDKIFELVKQKKQEGLKIMSRNGYYLMFNRVVNVYKLNPAHMPHDTRKTFVTMAKKYNVNEYALKRIVGHAITDVTERYYTDRPIEWLHEEISKIP